MPYVLFNGLMIILNNLFVNVGIYTDKAEFLKIAGRGCRDGLLGYMNISTILIKLIKTILFMDSTQMGGPTWFLRILFVV